MVELIAGLRADTVRANLAEVREEIAAAAAAAGRDPGEVEVLAATKYVSPQDLPVLAEAGIGLVGENRAQDLVAKVAGSTGIQPSSTSADEATTSGAQCTGIPKKRS